MVKTELKTDIACEIYCIFKFKVRIQTSSSNTTAAQPDALERFRSKYLCFIPGGGGIRYDTRRGRSAAKLPSLISVFAGSSHRTQRAPSSPLSPSGTSLQGALGHEHACSFPRCRSARTDGGFLFSRVWFVSVAIYSVFSSFQLAYRISSTS
jgi:hypothetical protein